MVAIAKVKQVVARSIGISGGKEERLTDAPMGVLATNNIRLPELNTCLGSWMTLSLRDQEGSACEECREGPAVIVDLNHRVDMFSA